MLRPLLWLLAPITTAALVSSSVMLAVTLWQA